MSLRLGMETSGERPSLWTPTSALPSYPSLSADIKADACVVGAGISGLTAAYCLAKEGLSVVVLEDGQIGSGETGRTSAHLSNALDDHYYFLEDKHGKKGARLAAESHASAIDWIESLVQS